MKHKVRQAACVEKTCRLGVPVGWGGVNRVSEVNGEHNFGTHLHLPAGREESLTKE